MKSVSALEWLAAEHKGSRPVATRYVCEKPHNDCLFLNGTVRNLVRAAIVMNRRESHGYRERTVDFAFFGPVGMSETLSRFFHLVTVF